MKARKFLWSLNGTIGEDQNRYDLFLPKIQNLEQKKNSFTFINIKFYYLLEFLKDLPG